MKSKNKNLFLKIYIPFVIVTIIAIIVLQILGSKKRIGYLTDFNLNIERTLALNNLKNINESFTVDGKLDEESIKNYLLTNENITNYVYQFRIRYYDKVFRNSDIYGVYVDLSNLPDYMENAEMERVGSPYGNFIYDKKSIEMEKIDNISYSLKLKYNQFFIYLILFIIIVLYCLINFNKKINELLIANYITRLDWIIFIIISIFCFLSFWHPMWIIFITPFLVFGTVINKKYNIFILLDIFLMLFFTCHLVNLWEHYLDSYALSKGIFNNILDIRNSSLLMKSIFKDSNWLSYTFFSGLLLLNALFKHPKYDFENINEDISDAMPFIRLRLVIGIMIFIIPCFMAALS